jgi:hypothetical protein
MESDIDREALDRVAVKIADGFERQASHQA